MAKLLDSIIEGINNPIIAYLTNRDFDSLADPAAFDATGKTITLELRGSDGVLVDTDGKVQWLDASNSIAVFAPSSGDLTSELSPYRARWFVDDGTVYAYPSKSQPDIWKVAKAT